MKGENRLLKFLKDCNRRQSSDMFTDQIGKPIDPPPEEKIGSMVYLSLHTPPPANRLKDLPRVEFKESINGGEEKMKSESITGESGGDEVAKSVTNIPKQLAKQVREEIESLKEHKGRLQTEYAQTQSRIAELITRADVLEKMAEEEEE